MANGEMPSGPMELARSGSLDDATKRRLSQAIQSLEKLNSDEVKVLREVLDALSKATTSSAETSDSTTVAADSGNATLNNAISVASRVQEIGFVEFTAGLINGTFDAIVGATIKQMEAYAKLVADLSKSIQQFQAENVSDAQITAYLAQNYPDGQGGTVVVADTAFPDTPADIQTGAAAKSGNEKLQEVVEALIAETKSLKEGQRLTREAQSLNITKNDTQIKQFNPDRVKKIRGAIAALLTTNMIEQLRQMARDGLARIVITDGEILTKLTFKITATTQQQKRRENYNQNINQTNIGGRVGGGWWGVSASTANTNINVNAVNESSFDSTTMDIEMIGEVRLRFRTETFTPINLPPPRESTETT